MDSGSTIPGVAKTATAAAVAIAPRITVKSSQTSGRDVALDENATVSAAMGLPLALRGMLSSYNPETRRYLQWNSSGWTVHISPPDAETAGLVALALTAFWNAVATGRLEALTAALKAFVYEAPAAK